MHDAIVARVRAAVPELATAEVLGSRVGLRPVAPAVGWRGIGSGAARS